MHVRTPPPSIGPPSRLLAGESRNPTLEQIRESERIWGKPTTPTNAPSSSVLIAGIEHLVTLLEAEVQALERQPHPLPVTKGGSGATQPAGPVSLDELDLLVVRLQQISDSLRKYPRLLPLVDDYIGAQVRAMEQRQSRQNLGLAAITTVIGVLLGWAVSLLGTPASLLHLFIR